MVALFCLPRTADLSLDRSNEQSKSIQCKVCFSTFMSTVKEPELRTHAENKHASKKKTFTDCFPEWVS